MEVCRLLTICPKIISLKSSRMKKGLSVRQLAKAADVNPVTISKIENGISKPTPSTAKKICDAIGVSFDELFELTSEKHTKEA